MQVDRADTAVPVLHVVIFIFISAIIYYPLISFLNHFYWIDPTDFQAYGPIVLSIPLAVMLCSILKKKRYSAAKNIVLTILFSLLMPFSSFIFMLMTTSGHFNKNSALLGFWLGPLLYTFIIYIMLKSAQSDILAGHNRD